MVYANEVKYLGPIIPGWVSDVTYIWIGDRWAMDVSMHRSLCIAALAMALKNHTAPQYHHSDRGVQYCSHDYIDILKANKVTPSMAAVGVFSENEAFEGLFE